MDKKHTNALINETSPYLLQHAHNPVQWHPWGEEALTLAKEKDIPILVSIGYSACHWCHVMERESFEDETAAGYMNNHFINIKIDREERPDLDQVYMDAVQAIAGNGGWPLNVFLTPEGKPFYGGTYFPPKKAFNRPSWMDVLQAMTDLWTNRRVEAEDQAAKLVDHITKSNNFAASTLGVPLTETVSFFNSDDCRLIAANLLKTADKEEGGFGSAPKFLQTYSIQYLLQYGHLYPNTEATAHAALTLTRMLQGGIYDQLGGGISRYSTDNAWLAPHFEKMLYDNALLTTVLCDAWQATRDDVFKRGIQSTLGFIVAEMKAPEGGYYTALDADTEHEEGKYYVWDAAVIKAFLGKDAPLFMAYYNIQEGGNWEGKNILHVTNTIEEQALQFKLTAQQALEIIERCKKMLLLERSKRIYPGVDDKIILSVNALLIAAFCKAYAALRDEAYLVAAEELAIFIEQKFENRKGGLLHTYKNGKARILAFLDDYAYMVQAYINLQEVTGNQQYLHKAKALTEYVEFHFGDEASEFYFYTQKQQEDIIVRKIDLYDGATPSPNAIMAANLIYLSRVFSHSAWQEKGVAMLSAVFNAFKKYPGSFAVWAGEYLRQTAGVKEIVITGVKTSEALAEILGIFIPNKLLQSHNKEDELPLLAGKNYKEDVNLYLCKNYSCGLPVQKSADLIAAIKN